MFALNELLPNDQRLMHSLLDDGNLISDKNEFLKTAIIFEDYPLVKKMLELGANPNILIQGYSAIEFTIYQQYAFVFDDSIRVIFQLLLEDSRTDLTGALDFAYQTRQKIMFLALANDPRINLNSNTFKAISNDDDQDYFEAIENQPAILKALGATLYLDQVLPKLAQSFGKKEREEAFIHRFVNNNDYDLAALYGYALYRNFRSAEKLIFAKDPTQLSFMNNEQGDDAFDLAIKNGDIEKITSLENNPDFNPNRINSVTGNAYLHTAVIYQQIEIIKMMKNDPRFDVTLKNVGGKTAYDLAVKFKLNEIKTILKSNPKEGK